MGFVTIKVGRLGELNKSIKINRFYKLAYEEFETYNKIYAPWGIHWIIRLWVNRKRDTYVNHWLFRGLIRYINKNFRVCPVDSDTCYAYSGEPFIEFTGYGKFDGYNGQSYKTKIGSIFAFNKKMKKYLSEAKSEGREYFQWRIRPRLSSRIFENNCYARFLCSAKSFESAIGGY